MDEILVLVNIALGRQDVTACPAADSDGDQAVTVNDVISAISAALNGCS